MTRLEEIVLAAYDRMIELNLDDMVVDDCIIKALCGAR